MVECEEEDLGAVSTLLHSLRLSAGKSEVILAALTVTGTAAAAAPLLSGILPALSSGVHFIQREP